MEPILPGAPWLVAHKSMLSMNQPSKVTLNGQDYVLWQNQQGEVFALNNVCPHMQAPLSAGWICQDRNTIACPFHALEFDGQGKLYRDNQWATHAIAQPLDLIIDGDCIWTYGGLEPRLPIPDLIPRASNGFQFVGVAGEKSIQSDFLTNMKINYDFNHQNGTHRALFRIKQVNVSDYEELDYCTKLAMQAVRDENTLRELLANPALAIVPKILSSQFEYSFPALTSLVNTAPIGQFIQIHVLYPETESCTKTFVLVFAKFKVPVLATLLKRSILKSVAQVVEQDSITVEKLYARQQPKIQLPHEEVMFYAEKLYHNW